MIKAQGLGRIFESYRKDEGLKGSIKGLFNRQTIQKVALAPIDIDLDSGQIVGLVGANGAGKTTLIKLLTGLIHPTHGKAQVLGFTPHLRESLFLKNIGVILGQKNQLWWDLTPADSFGLLGQIYDIPEKDRKFRMLELAEWLQCRHVLDIQLRRLSLGERMKMEIIGAILHRPKILFLDEPTIGLDIVAQSRIRTFLSDYVKVEKPLIILTSHYMTDIASLAQHLILLSQGRKVFDGSLDDFMSQVTQTKKLIISFHQPLKQSIQFGEFQIEAGIIKWQQDLSNSQLISTLKYLEALPNIQELKIEESDFEDVIQKFLEAQL
jgi:ABC-2 type transport system ATP-binding protein